MQSTFATHFPNLVLAPDILFAAVTFLLAALILFTLALEAGTYPEIAEGFRRLRKSMDHLRSQHVSQVSNPGRNQAVKQ